MNIGNREFYQNLSYLLCDNMLQKKVEKDQGQVSQSLQRLFNISLAIFQSKLSYQIKHAFDKFKHNMKSLKNRDLIYQAIFKSTSLKTDNQNKKCQLKIESDQKQKTAEEQMTNIVQDKNEPSKNGQQYMRQGGNQVKVSKKPQSVKQYPNVKFFSMQNTVPRRASFDHGRQLTVNRIKTKAEYNHQNINHQDCTRQKNNQLRYKEVVNFNVEKYQNTDQNSKKVSQQIYLVKSSCKKTKRDKVIRFIKVPIVTENLQIFNQEKKFINIQNKTPKVHQFLQQRRKYQPSRDFNPQILRLDLSKLKDRTKDLYENQKQCKYCVSVMRAKRLVSAHSERTSTNTSSFY